MTWSLSTFSYVGTSTTSGNTINPGEMPAPANALILFGIAFDNTTATTPSVSSVTKPAGETATWTKLAYIDSPSATGNAAVRGEVWGIVTTTSWAGHTPTFTLSGSVAAKVLVGRWLTNDAGTPVLTTRTSSLPRAGVNGTGSATRTQTETGVLTGDLVVGFAISETNAFVSLDSDTTGGAWDTLAVANTASGGGAANVSGHLQYKVPSSGGTQSFDTSVSDGGVVIIALQPPSAAAAVSPAIRVSNPAHRRSYTW